MIFFFTCGFVWIIISQGFCITPGCFQNPPLTAEADDDGFTNSYLHSFICWTKAALRGAARPQVWWNSESNLLLGQLEPLGVGMNNRSSQFRGEKGSGELSSSCCWALQLTQQHWTLRSPLLHGAANSFQMKDVYLAYWLNQLLPLTGTSHFPQRQIGDMRTGRGSHVLPFPEGKTALWDQACVTPGSAAPGPWAWRGNESKSCLRKTPRTWVFIFLTWNY